MLSFLKPTQKLVISCVHHLLYLKYNLGTKLHPCHYLSLCIVCRSSSFSLEYIQKGHKVDGDSVSLLALNYSKDTFHKLYSSHRHIASAGTLLVQCKHRSI